MKDWWKDYFDEIYLRIYPHSSRKELTLKQVDFIERALNLEKGASCNQYVYILGLFLR